MLIKRFANNPIITPADVQPSRPDFEVMCAFNAGATIKDGETILLVRVAERPIPEPGYVSTVMLDLENSGNYKVIRIKLDDPDLDFTDPRVFHYKGVLYLTSISHLRLARSTDGREFTVDPTPTLRPEDPTEIYGIEDPRITRIDDAWYINFSSISLQGVLTALVRTQDFVNFERMGVIFAPDNKDVAIFPEAINGRYYALHRPRMQMIGRPSMWLAGSDNLRDWGQHRQLIAPRPDSWDSHSVGCGANPIRTDDGWLCLYHASDIDDCYQAGILLLDLEDPGTIIARSDKPVFSAECDYETSGLMASVVFHNGWVKRDDDTVDFYYGAADTITCGASFSIPELLAHARG